MSDIVLAAINAKWIHPSLALRLLKANLGELEERAEIAEFALRQPLAEKVAAIIAARAKILAISVSIWNHAATLELLKALSVRWRAGDGGTRPIVVLGGPEASHLPLESPLFQECDWLVRGEGEHAFRELCAALLAGRKPESGEHIASVTIAGRPGVVTASTVDPATIDSGYRLYTDEDLGRKLTYVEASRGCPFGCEFCLSSLDRRVRYFPLEKFLADMAELLSRGARSFKFLDRTFNLDTGRAREIMEFYLANLGPAAYVHFEMIPSRYPGELREILERFPPGTLRLEVGIQTFEPSVAATIGRPSDPPKEIEALDFLRRRTTAIVHADLIAGLPGETAESFARGFDKLWSARPTEIQLGILKRLPGAPLSRHDARYGMRYAVAPPYEVEATATMSETELGRIKNFARFWELVVNRGHFPDLAARLLPEGADAFRRFMALSDALLLVFGKNWGIDRGALRTAVSDWIDKNPVAASIQVETLSTRKAP